MNKQLENHNSMFGAVDEFFIEKAPKIEALPALKEKVLSFRQVRADIESTLKEIIRSGSGKTTAKDQAESEMLNAGFDIKSSLVTFAQDTLNHLLEEIASIPEWRLSQMRDTEQKVYCTTLYELALANQEPLTKYGVTPEEITGFKTRIDKFSTAMQTREATPAASGALRKSLDKLFTDGAVLLERIDQLMKRFRTKDPEFYNGYKSARTVKSVGIRHKPKDDSQSQPPPAA